MVEVKELETIFSKKQCWASLRKQSLQLNLFQMILTVYQPFQDFSAPLRSATLKKILGSLQTTNHSKHVVSTGAV